MAAPLNKTVWPLNEPLCTRYGLTQGQTRVIDRRVQNGVWFDVHWQMIGWGDLADDDLVRIARSIAFGDLFIVINSNVQPITQDLQYCSWLVERGCIYRVMWFTDNLGDETYDEQVQGMRMRRIIRSTAASIVERINRLIS